jgi:SAM-dependent methyltransferase
MRVGEGNLNDHLDLPHLLERVPPGGEGRALDLGCGLGQASFKLAEKFGYRVVAVDFDGDLLANAKNIYSGDRISWVHSTFNTLDFSPSSFSLIISCLTFHFVEDLSALFKNCANWLSPGGKFIFSVRHPIRTSNPLGQVQIDGKVGWTVTDYFTDCPRDFAWLGEKCRNFHRPLASYFWTLKQAGLEVEEIVEPSMATSVHPSASESNCVPFFLLFSSRKPY